MFIGKRCSDSWHYFTVILITSPFRSESGARMFCRIRGYISTIKKQGLNVLDAFISLFSAHPQPPIPQTE